jgi:hypothetical protein
MLWESSIYKFRVPVDPNQPEESQLKEIGIDVTLSAPPFNEPGEVLGGVFENVFESISSKSKLNVLDFGAAKLRNTIYFLEKGHSVRAVEFEKLLNQVDQARQMHEKAKRFKDKFGELVLPHAFVNSKERFDLVLLINVLSTMPVPAERLMVLQHCHDKLKSGGFLFYYTMHGDAYYRKNCTDDVRIGDGYYMNKGKFKSFFREFNEVEEDFMFMSSGFDLAVKYIVKNNHARLYQKKSTNLLKDTIVLSALEKIALAGQGLADPETVEPKIVNQDESTREILPNPHKWDLDALWLEKLKTVSVGTADATNFQWLMTLVLRRVFEPDLTNFKVEHLNTGGRKRAEITASNRSAKGFFAWLRDSTVIKCPLIFVGCWNYKTIDQDEVERFANKLTTLNGEFGLLIYRGVENRTKILERCRKFLEAQKYIVPLTDRDVVNLFKMRVEGEEDEVLNCLDDRFKELIVSKVSTTRRPGSVARPPRPATVQRKPGIFLSYSHEDDQEKDLLQTHLEVLQTAGRVAVWSDDRIEAGGKWETEIEQAIADSSVAVLLISASFLTSAFINTREVPALLRKHKEAGLHIVPVLGKPCAWKQVDWLKELNMRPKNSKSVWRDGGKYADDELAVIVDEIAAIISRKTKKR